MGKKDVNVISSEGSGMALYLGKKNLPRRDHLGSHDIGPIEENWLTTWLFRIGLVGQTSCPGIDIKKSIVHLQANRIGCGKGSQAPKCLSWVFP